MSVAALKLLLLLTFVVAYLNPVLRASEESIFTAFRLILPVVSVVLFARFMRHPSTKLTVLYVGMTLIYSFAQMMLFGLLSDSFILSYLVNIVALIIFIYFVVSYQRLYGRESLFSHLYLWYIVLVTTSIHQLLTGFNYPNAPYREGVARIFLGQENDTSLALAAFIPVLIQRCARDPLAAVLLVTGVYIIYVNSTRGVLIGVAAYPIMVAMFWLIGAFGRHAKILVPLIGVLILGVLIALVGVFKDAPIEMANGESSLSELIIDPLMEITTGEKMDAELTSINLRVTMAIVGIQQFFSTFGFGVGPGASTYFVEKYYSGIAASMHIFPLQLLTECGWLFVATMVWVTIKFGRQLGWQKFVPLLVFFNLVTSSITAGAITNYYFFACVVFALTAARYAQDRGVRAIQKPILTRTGNAPVPM